MLNNNVNFKPQNTMNFRAARVTCTPDKQPELNGANTALSEAEEKGRCKFRITEEKPYSFVYRYPVKLHSPELMLLEDAEKMRKALEEEAKAAGLLKDLGLEIEQDITGYKEKIKQIEVHGEETFPVLSREDYARKEIESGLKRLAEQKKITAQIKTAQQSKK